MYYLDPIHVCNVCTLYCYRYGDGPASCPFLWDLMSRYTETMATMFDGVRLDNCHNTPIHVSSYLLHRARLVNPNVIVLAELFTGSLERDAEFVGRLGITALVREGMHCKSDKALSDEVYKASVGTGEHCSPILSLYPFFPTSITSYPVDGDGEVAQWESVLWTAPSAMFYDCTHDNDPCCVVHEAEHALALSTIVAASCAASGMWCRYMRRDDFVFLPFNCHSFLIGMYFMDCTLCRKCAWV